MVLFLADKGPQLLTGRLDAALVPGKPGELKDQLDLLVGDVGVVEVSLQFAQEEVDLFNIEVGVQVAQQLVYDQLGLLVAFLDGAPDDLKVI